MQKQLITLHGCLINVFSAAAFQCAKMSTKVALKHNEAANEQKHTALMKINLMRVVLFWYLLYEIKNWLMIVK